MSRRMPQRPRQHELETESKRAFATLLPSSWIIHERGSGDYGVDLDVEIFEGGCATGLVFKVQLKATDSQPRNEIHTVRVRATTFNYWSTLESPVMVALYVARSGDVYWAWAHSYDPFAVERPRKVSQARVANRGTPTAPAAKSMTFRLDRGNQLSKISASNIRRDIMIVRQFKSGPGAFPLAIFFSRLEGWPSIDERLTYLRLAELRNEFGSILDVVSDEAGAHATLAVTSRYLLLTMAARMASVTIHDLSHQVGDEEDIADLFALALATLMFRFGHTGKALQLLRRRGAHIRLGLNENCLWMAFGALMAQQRASDAVELLLPLIDCQTATVRQNASIPLSLILLGPNHLPMRDKERLRDALDRRAQVELNESQPLRAAQTRYTLGQLDNAEGRYAEAIAEYAEALRLDPTYGDRSYFYCERAGMHYHNADLESAILDYRKASDIGGNAEASFLLCDCLLKAGRYSEADSIQLDNATKSQPYGGAARILERIRGFVHAQAIERQDRRPLSGDEIDSIDLPALTYAQVQALLREADALDPRLLLALADKAETRNETHLASLASAYLVESDPHLWLLAMITGVADGATVNELDDIYRSALRTGAGHADLYRATAGAVDQFDAAAVAATQAAISNRSGLRAPSRPRTLRTIGSDGAVTDTFELHYYGG